jgi:hypothetical protein
MTEIIYIWNDLANAWVPVDAPAGTPNLPAGSERLSENYYTENNKEYIVVLDETIKAVAKEVQNNNIKFPGSDAIKNYESYRKSTSNKGLVEPNTSLYKQEGPSPAQNIRSKVSEFLGNLESPFGGISGKAAQSQKESIISQREQTLNPSFKTEGSVPFAEDKKVNTFVAGTPGAVLGKQLKGSPTNPIVGNPNINEIMEVEVGVYNLPGKEGEFLLLGDPTNEKFSRPIALEDYKTQIRGWTPESVVAYKKAIKYGNTTPLADSKFADAVIEKAKEVSDINYYNAKNNKPQQISIEGYISNPTKYGAAGFGSGGTVVSAKELKAKTATVKQLTTELGVTLSDKEIKDIAYQYASGAIDANTIKYQVAKAGDIDYTKGTAASTLTELKKLAADNGISYNDTWFQTAAGNIITGRSTLDTLKADINNQAKGIYSAESIQKGIDAGFSVRAQASPYINYLANIRGADPESISLNDPFISQAFTARDDKGNPTVMSYFDFRKNVRQNDPQWGYSDEAQTETTSMLRKFGQVFGKSF